MENGNRSHVWDEHETLTWKNISFMFLKCWSRSILSWLKFCMEIFMFFEYQKRLLSEIYVMWMRLLYWWYQTEQLEGSELFNLHLIERVDVMRRDDETFYIRQTFDFRLFTLAYARCWFLDFDFNTEMKNHCSWG